MLLSTRDNGPDSVSKVTPQSTLETAWMYTPLKGTAIDIIVFNFILR